jgi:hypothetical protein
MQNKNLTDMIKGRETQIKLGSTAVSWKRLGRLTGGLLACWGLLVCLVVWGISSSVIAHEGHSHDNDNEGGGLQVDDHADDIIIPAGITGAWFNPDHDGEGFFIEVVDANNNDNNNRTFVVSFYSYEEGRQMWLLGSAPLEAGARSVNVPMEIFSGGREGSDLSEFDPETVQRENWGTMEFHFFSCDQGDVHYEEEQFGFSGDIALTRLTTIAELGCEEPVDEQPLEGQPQ